MNFCGQLFAGGIIRMHKTWVSFLGALWGPFGVHFSNYFVKKFFTWRICQTYPPPEPWQSYILKQTWCLFVRLSIEVLKPRSLLKLSPWTRGPKNYLKPQSHTFTSLLTESWVSRAQKLFRTSITNFYFFTYWVLSPESRPIQVPSPNTQASNYLLGCLRSKSRTIKKTWRGPWPGEVPRPFIHPVWMCDAVWGQMVRSAGQTGVHRAQWAGQTGLGSAHRTCRGASQCPKVTGTH
jgi:hypothetical protein